MMLLLNRQCLHKPVRSIIIIVICCVKCAKNFSESAQLQISKRYLYNLSSECFDKLLKPIILYYFEWEDQSVLYFPYCTV